MTDLTGIGNKHVPNWDAAANGVKGQNPVSGSTGGREGVDSQQSLTISWAQQEMDIADEIPDSALNRNDEFAEPCKMAYNIPVPSWLEVQKSWGGS